MKILIIEDDKEIVRFIKTGLEARSYIVDAAYDGEQGSFLARTETYDLIILDYNLPKCRGDQVISEIRSDGKMTPIIVLSIQAEFECKQQMYTLGADDYITKPFLFEELILKIRAIWKRPAISRDELIKIGNLEIDEGAQIAKRGSRMLQLTRKEFSLLSYLAQNQGRIISRSQILENVWDINADPFSNTIEAHMANLRKKLRQKHQNEIIHTFPGQGYKLSLKRFSP